VLPCLLAVQGIPPPGTPLPPGLDPNFVVSQVIPLIGVIAVVVFGALGLRWLFRTPVGEAIAERIREGRRHGRRTIGGEDRAQATALQERVAQLEGQLSELAERVDFTERLLAKQRNADRLAPPR